MCGRWRSRETWDTFLPDCKTPQVQNREQEINVLKSQRSCFLAVLKMSHESPHSALQAKCSLP